MDELLTGPGAEHWALLDTFRESIEAKFRTEVLMDEGRLAAYDEVISSAMGALEGRGFDLSDDTTRYIAASSIAWAANTVAKMTVMECNDPHVIGHLKNAVMWPAYVVRELSLDHPLPEEASDALPEV